MKRITIIFFILVGLNGMSPGQTLNEYLQIAAENNPEVKASFYDYLAEMEKIPQVGLLPDPEQIGRAHV